MSHFHQARVGFRFALELAPFAVMAMTMVAPVQAQVLLSDTFTGTDGSYIDSSKWKVPPGGDGASYGQTTAKTGLNDLATIKDGAAVLQLDTFLPGNTGAPEDRAFGAEFLGRSSYAVGGGLVWEARVKFGSGLDTGMAGTPGVIAPPPSGFVGGAFLFDVTNAFNTAADPLVRDESDVELLSKQPISVLTNTYNDDGFPGVGGNPDLLANPVGGYSPFDYHDYKMTITPTATPGETETKWFVDNTLVRTVTGSSGPNYSANDGMTPHFNLWMPDSGFVDAYDGNLSAGSAGANETYTMSVDSVSLTRLNTSKGPNLVSNGGFDADGGTIGEGLAITDWSNFNNTSVSDEAGDSGDGDGLALKTFQCCNGGGFNASGVQRDIPVTAGDELSFSVDALTLSADSIAGRDQQFAEVWIRFEDSAGGNILSRRTGVIMDGGDPDLVEDTWHSISLEGIAPAGAVSANIQLGHISNYVPPPMGPAGSIFWDNVQLSVLSVSASAPDGDYDDGGLVEQTDLDLVLLNWGAAVPPIPTNPVLWVNQVPTDDGIVDQNDLDGVLLNWGNTLAAGAVGAVPEPSALLLMVFGGCLAMARRRARAIVT